MARLRHVRRAGSAHETQEGDHDAGDRYPSPDGPLNEAQFERDKAGVKHVGRQVVALLGSLANGGGDGIRLCRCQLGIGQVCGRLRACRTWLNPVYRRLAIGYQRLVEVNGSSAGSPSGTTRGQLPRPRSRTGDAAASSVAESASSVTVSTGRSWRLSHTGASFPTRGTMSSGATPGVLGPRTVAARRDPAVSYRARGGVLRGAGAVVARAGPRPARAG